MRSRPFWLELLKELKEKAGASVLISICIHLTLFLFLAIPVFRAIQPDLPLTTVVDAVELPEESAIIGDSLSEGLDLTTMEPASNEESTPQSVIPFQAEALATLDIDPEQTPGLTVGKAPAGNGTASQKTVAKKGNGGTGTSGRTYVPTNAIQAGNFTVWSWPILGKDLQGRFRHSEPGSFPLVGQDYHIVIRIKVPEDRKSIEISDLSGEILGTDHYRQVIPYDAWYVPPGGELVAARPTRKIPVIDGTAEVLIRVPAATGPKTKDTITVASKILQEEQKIELVFLAPGSSMETDKPATTEKRESTPPQ